MRLKASTEYGLRAVLYLAYKDGLCSSRDIARDMAIPRDYLIQLAQLLRNAGIVEARPGKHGGYRLAKRPDEISLLAVMAALEDDGAKSVSQETQSEGQDSLLAQKARRAYMLALENHEAYLDAITLGTLLECSENEETAKAFLAAQLQAQGERLALEAS